MWALWPPRCGKLVPFVSVSSAEGEAQATGHSKSFNSEALGGTHLAPLTQIEELTLHSQT